MILHIKLQVENIGDQNIYLQHGKHADTPLQNICVKNHFIRLMDNNFQVAILYTKEKLSGIINLFGW